MGNFVFLQVNYETIICKLLLTFLKKVKAETILR